MVGKHNGIHTWTVGQRCNLAGFHKPYFVQSKNSSSNIIFVASGTNHPSLYSSSLFTSEPCWINEPDELANNLLVNCKFRFQHTKPLVDCLVYRLNNGKLFVKLKSPLRAITPGQYAVFYKRQECLGSARILSPGPSMLYSKDQCFTQLEEQESLTKIERITNS